MNWCPRCTTAISDLEVEYQEVQGKLWHVRYPFKGSDNFVVVATTRPETMLGDTAVAVHPEDERYASIQNKTIVLPLIGREIPINGKCRSGYLDEGEICIYTSILGKF